MRNREAERWSEMIMVMAFMTLILITFSLSSPAIERATETFSWVIEQLKGAPPQRTPEEIRERWRVTRPGMLLSKDFVPKSEAPGLRELKAKENGQSVSPTLQQAIGNEGRVIEQNNLEKMAVSSDYEQVGKRIGISSFPGQNDERAPFADERFAYRPTRTGGMPTIQYPKGVPYSKNTPLSARE
jgi:hypothetical protein